MQNRSATSIDKQLRNGTARQTTMEAAVISQAGKFELRQAPLPEPAARQVRIKIEGCGLCASNIPPWEGREWFEYPFAPGAPGHEGWGTVDKTGENVQGLKPGDRVAALTYHAFAEYDLADDTSVVKLPRKLRGEPFPAEPLACAMNILHRSRIWPGETVAIVGTGFLGQLLVQLAVAEGAKVIALSRRQSSLAMAAKNGAEKTIELKDHYQIIDEVKRYTKGHFCDCVIECTGKEWPLNLAGELTKERGRLVVAGFHQDGMRQVNMQLWNWRGLDVINAHERDPKQYIRGMKAAIKAVEEGRMNPRPLFTHFFRKKDIQQAFEMHRKKPDGFVKALVLF